MLSHRHVWVDGRGYARPMRWLRLGLVGAVLLLGGLTIAPAAGQNANKQINITGPPFAFDPAGAQIDSGLSFLFENRTTEEHNIVSAEFTRHVNAGIEQRSQPVQISGGPRTIAYHCTIHDSMTGSLQVVGSTPAATSTTVAASPATTRAGVTTTRKGATTIATTGTFDTQTSVLDTTTSEPASSTTAAPLAIKEASKGGGTSSAAIAGILVAIVAVLGGGAYALYRLRGAGN